MIGVASQNGSGLGDEFLCGRRRLLGRPGNAFQTNQDLPKMLVASRACLFKPATDDLFQARAVGLGIKLCKRFPQLIREGLVFGQVARLPRRDGPATRGPGPLVWLRARGVSVGSMSG